MINFTYLKHFFLSDSKNLFEMLIQGFENIKIYMHEAFLRLFLLGSKLPHIG